MPPRRPRSTTPSSGRRTRLARAVRRCGSLTGRPGWLPLALPPADCGVLWPRLPGRLGFLRFVGYRFWGRKSLRCPALSPLHGARGPYAIAVMWRVFSCADHVTQVGARSCIGREIRIEKKRLKCQNTKILTLPCPMISWLLYPLIRSPPPSKICVRYSRPLITAPRPVITLHGKICEIARNPVESTAPVACPILIGIASTL